MLGYDWFMLAVMSGALITGGVVKGVVGLGLPIVTLAILLNFMPPLTVLGLLVAPILVTNLWQSLRAGNLLQPLGRFWPMIVMAVIFLFIGAELIVGMDTAVLFAVLGCFVVVFSATNLIKPRVHPLKPETEKWAGPLAGALGGLLGGISTIWGPPMMMYFVMLKLDKDTFVRTVGLAWFSMAVPLTFAYWRNGIFTGDVIPLSLAACVPGMIGIRIGEKIRQHIDQETFRKVMLAVLLIIGLNLIRRAVF
ncbi:MAG: sulfite exporter TauE/SafE family protein [Proteobacteria bacterium]|nr:sulfite exporter TauE/SafE family protein [Pseudomonadota bacterium]